jgi:hypothetical protein
MEEQEQTAVEWLVEQLANEKLGSERHFEIIEEAKQMFKWQIINAVNTGDSTNFWDTYSSAEDYYNQSYNKSNQ